MTPRDLKRFEDKYTVDKATGCWIWNAYTRPDGYGSFSLNDRIDCAHRVSYKLFVNQEIDGLSIDHLCRRRNCVNPKHLEAVTQRENVLRGEGTAAKNASKTHCPQGHEFSKENLYINPAGARCCRECRRIRQRKN